ncbi:hypothetical protein ACIRST_40460 [Kitasatospora sp. NPDC101447]|uniref:hypothetical protein n=1 Tax=Kitasatospora sp. NPDC101447 TaxID=3364102 RepID=UPI00380A548B
MTTTSGAHAGLPVPLPDVLPDPWVVVRGTAWPSLDTAFGSGRRLPRALVRLLDPDLTAGEARQALNALDEPVRHQNTIYEATAPVTLCVAAVLGRRAGQHRGTADRVCTLLLAWLAGVAYDSDDKCVAVRQRYFGEDFLEGYPALVAVRALRPVLFQAVEPFLDDPDAAVAEEALCAGLALAEHPALAGHRDGPAERARRLLRVCDTRWRRRQALDALTAWGHDTEGLARRGDDDRSPYVDGAGWPVADGHPDGPPL